jgi:hypothetical protein
LSPGTSWRAVPTTVAGLPAQCERAGDAMFFRFMAALLLVVLISMTGIRLEKQTLELRRAVSVQHYQSDELLDLLVHLRLESQRLLAPSVDRFATAAVESSRDSAPTHAAASESPRKPGNRGSELPLLQFSPPFDPQGIE